MNESWPTSDLLVILRHPPHGSNWLREGLDAALVAAAFERQVSLLFMGEGVMALVEGQQEGPLGQKGTAPILEMLAMYDIETLLVEDAALSRYGFAEADLMLPIERLPGERLATLAAEHRLVLTF